MTVEILQARLRPEPIDNLYCGVYITGMDTTTRLQIRNTTYRGRAGFTVSGQGRGIFPVRIFAETRDAAEHIREMVRRDLDVEMVDFGGHDAGLSGYCTRCMGKVAA